MSLTSSNQVNRFHPHYFVNEIKISGPLDNPIHLFPTPHDALRELWVELPLRRKQSFTAVTVLLLIHSFIAR